MLASAWGSVLETDAATTGSGVSGVAAVPSSGESVAWVCSIQIHQSSMSADTFLQLIYMVFVYLLYRFAIRTGLGVPQYNFRLREISDINFVSPESRQNEQGRA